MDRQSRKRTEAALARGKPSRRPRECILIICEGEETEPNYFNSLWRHIRLRTVEVKVVGQGAEILGVVAAALQLRDEREDDARESVQTAPFDEVWCVVDTESRNHNPSWERGVDKATSNGLRLAWSNPCFEYWILLHFDRVGRNFYGYEGIKPHLRRHIPTYEKASDYFEVLAPRIPRAIENSKGVHRAQWQDTPRAIDCNPATTAHELVERLIEVAGMTVDQYRSRYPLREQTKRKSIRARRS